MFVNGTGAVATGITTLIVLVAKFTSGAWIVALLVPTLIVLMVAIEEALQASQGRGGRDGPAQPDQHAAAAGGHPHGPLGPHDREGPALRPAALQGDQSRQRHRRRRRRDAGRRLGGERHSSPSAIRACRAGTHHPPLHHPPGHHAADGLHPGTGAAEPRPQDHRAAARTRGQPLVGVPAAQPACADAEAAAPDQGKQRIIVVNIPWYL